MKKLVLIVVLVVPALLFLSALSVLADDSNFVKAGETAYLESEAVLQQKAAELEEFVQKAAEDRVIAKSEMLTLKRLVDDFNKTKSEFDKELKLYNLETSVALDEEYQVAVDAYFLGDLLFKEDNKDEGARRLFVSKTGLDVKIERGAVFHCANIFLIVVTIICLGIFIAASIAKASNWAIASGIFFVTFLLLLLLG